MIRALRASDADWVVELNAANVIATAPMNRERFLHMLSQSLLALVFGERDAFMIAFSQTADYDSPNFLWFRERYAAFAYVDRIVVSGSARGRGIARALYQRLFEVAAKAGLDRVACEVNVSPPNPASDAFHASLGFSEVGRSALANGTSVRYLLRPLP